MALYSPSFMSDEELSCPICFEEFDQYEQEHLPKLLLCLHTFCQACITNLRKYDGSLQCSICRTNHSIRQPRDLLDNYVIVDYLRKKQLIDDERLANELKREYEEQRQRNEEEEELSMAVIREEERIKQEEEAQRIREEEERIREEEERIRERTREEERRCAEDRIHVQKVQNNEISQSETQERREVLSYVEVESSEEEENEEESGEEEEREDNQVREERRGEGDSTSPTQTPYILLTDESLLSEENLDCTTIDTTDGTMDIVPHPLSEDGGDSDEWTDMEEGEEEGREETNVIIEGAEGERPDDEEEKEEVPDLLSEEFSGVSYISFPPHSTSSPHSASPLPPYPYSPNSLCVGNSTIHLCDLTDSDSEIPLPLNSTSNSCSGSGSDEEDDSVLCEYLSPSSSSHDGARNQQRVVKRNSASNEHVPIAPCEECSLQ